MIRYSDIERERLLRLSQECLWSDEGGPGRDYLQVQRGLSEETIRRFGLGFIPKDSGHQLANRVVFPLKDPSGNLIVLTTRRIDESLRILPVYWHEAFDKSAYLFGMDNAKDRIRKTGFAIIVEGQFDVLQCHNYGVTNTVGTLGTNLDEVHLSILKRYCDELILLFDTDTNMSGEKGVRRAEERISRYSVRVDPHDDHLGDACKSLFRHASVTLPDKDPDLFLRSRGVDEFKRPIRQELDRLRRSDARAV